MKRLRSVAVTRSGVEFVYEGDLVIYLWPWRRGPDTRPLLSVGLSGTGEFGDVRVRSLFQATGTRGPTPS